MRRGNPLPRGVVLDGSTFGGHGRGHVGRDRSWLGSEWLDGKAATGRVGVIAFVRRKLRVCLVAVKVDGGDDTGLFLAVAPVGSHGSHSSTPRMEDGR